MRKFIISKEKEILEVALLKNKEDKTFSFVNLTKGHICTCNFNSEEEAIKDLEARKEAGRIVEYHEVDKDVRPIKLYCYAGGLMETQGQYEWTLVGTGYGKSLVEACEELCKRDKSFADYYEHKDEPTFFCWRIYDSIQKFKEKIIKIDIEN